MAQGKSGSSGSKASNTRNDNRKNGKASKKRPGVSPGAHNGKSKGGYSLKPELVEARAQRKDKRAAERNKKKAAA